MRSTYIDPRFLPDRNYVINPKLAESGTTWSAISTTGPGRSAVADLYGVQWGYVATPSATQARVYTQQTIAQTLYQAGAHITCSMWVKLAAGGRYRISHGNASGTMLEFTSFTASGNWERVSVEAIGQASLRLEIRVSDAIGVGVPMTVTKAMVSEGWASEGARVPVYCDGDTPGWKWGSTPNASPSIGTPYTLESLVGEPYLQLTGAGTVVRVDKIALTEDRFVVGVYDILTPGNTLNYPALTQLNNSADGNQAMRTYGHLAGDSSARIFGRVQSSGSIVADYTLTPGYRSPGRHVVIHSTGGNVAWHKLAATRVDGVVSYGAQAAVPADRQHVANRLISTTTADATMAWQAAYRGTISDTTRVLLMRWLANAYGVFANA